MPDPEKTAVDPSQPAAGGWVPTPAQRAGGVAAVAALGSFAATAPSIIPGKGGLIAAAVCAALALGIATVLGMNSAGPRNLQ